MTSLAKQLKKLAIPGQPSFQQLSSKKRTPSLLFQPEDIGDITVDTIYSLALNGLEELISMDASFSEFEGSLFSESSKGFERTMQTSEVLEGVDKKISKFLRQLPPYFMLKPAHKCLEWLVRVYRVHCYNVDALMECALPYYQTVLFARIVQLLPLRDHSLSKWAWLAPIRKSGTPLSKLTLTQHCLSDLSFLVFMCEMVPASLKACRRSSSSNASRMAVSLYTSTVLNVLEMANPVTEDLVARLVPFFKRGLKSESVEYKASTYMVLSQLAVTVEMEEALVVGLLELVCKSVCESMIKEGLCCVAVLCQSQKPPRFSHKSLQYLLGLPSLVSTLFTLYQSHFITPLLCLLESSLLRGCLDHHLWKEAQEDVDACVGLLEELLAEIKMDQETALKFSKELLLSGVSALEASPGRTTQYMEVVRRILTTLAGSMDAKYPAAMDKALEQSLAAIYSQSHTHHSKTTKVTNDPASNERVKLLHELVSSSLAHTSRHQVFVELGASLSASVHHPNADMRAVAFTKLGERLTAHCKVKIDFVKDGFVVSSLLHGLADDSPIVIQAVLSLGRKNIESWLARVVGISRKHRVIFQQCPSRLLSGVPHRDATVKMVLFQLLPLDQLVSSLTYILVRKSVHRICDQWQDVCLSAVSLLTSKSMLAASSDVLDSVVVMLIPLLLVDRSGKGLARSLVETVGQSRADKSHPVLEALAQLSGKQDWLLDTSPGSDEDKDKVAAANCTVFSRVAGGVVKLKGDLLDNMLEKLVDATLSSADVDTYAYFAYMAVIISILEATPTLPIDSQHQLVRRFLRHLNEISSIVDGRGEMAKTSILDGGLEAAFHALLEQPCSRTTTHQMFYVCALQALCDHIVVPQELSSSMWLDLSKTSSQEQLYYDLLVSLFSQLIFMVNSQHKIKTLTSGKLLLQNFFKRCLCGCGTLLRFLAMIWTAPAGMKLKHGAVLDPVLQSCSLGIGCAYIQSLDSQAAVALIKEHCPIVPSLLIPLGSQHKAVRECAINCLQALQDACSSAHPLLDTTPSSVSSATPGFLRLVRGVSNVWLEVSMDPSQICEVLRRLQDSVVPEPPPTPSKRRSKRLAGIKTTPSSSEDGGVVPKTWLEGVVMHAVCLGMPGYVQNQVLTLLTRVDDANKLLSLIPLLCTIMDELLEKQKITMDVDDPLPQDDTKGLSSDSEKTLCLLVQCFTPSMAASFTHHPHLLRIFLQLLKTDTPLTHTAPPSSPQSLAMKQLSPAFFSQLGSHDLQLEVLHCLVDILVETKSSDVTNSIKHIIGKFSLTVDLVSQEILRDLSDTGVEEDPLPTPKKRKRNARATESATPSTGGGSVTQEDGILSNIWKRVAVVMELVETSCHTLPQSHLLVPVLFKCLARILDVEEGERLSLEYVQQLLLSCLQTITHFYIEQDPNTSVLLSESQFNVELVVHCVRLSSSPQTHHLALLLLTCAAQLFPGLVLHNIMPIFTFMGAQLVRQDDLYSFQVITKTIDTIIPTLIKSGSLVPKTPSKKSRAKKRSPSSPQDPSTVEEIVTEIIRIFVDALPHIPDHRKLPLFGHLLRRMGPREYLHMALGIMTEKMVLQRNGEHDQIIEENKLDSSFVVGVAQQFSPADQILSAGKLAEYISHLPDVKPTTASRLRQIPPSVCSLFNVVAHSDQQLQSFKLTALSLLSTLLSHSQFLSQVASSVDGGDLEEEILNVLRVILKYCSRLSGGSGTGHREEGGAKKGTVMYKCLKSSYNVLDKVTSLLQPASFLDVMVQLVGVVDERGSSGESSQEVQRRALEILAVKMAAKTFRFNEENMEALLGLGEVCAEVGVSGTVSTHTRRTALKCVGLLVALLDTSQTNRIQQLAERVLSLLLSSESEGEVPASVRGACLQCMCEFCQVLGAHLIPLLPRLLPALTRHLDVQGSFNKRHERLLLDALSAVNAVVKILSKFLSSSVSQIIIKLCELAGPRCGGDSNTKIRRAAEDVRSEVSTRVPVRNLLMAYHKCYSDLSSQEECVRALLGMLSATVARLTKDDITVHEDLLCDIITSYLDYRTSHTPDVSSMASVLLVEKTCVQVFTDLSVKLSEPQFRQLFLKLLDWATNSSSPKLRLISFYHLASETADKLKNLFLLFAGHFFSNAVNLLDCAHSQKEGYRVFTTDSDEEDKDLCVNHCCLLLEYVLQCLSKCFLYDRTEFVTRDRLDAILLPLVNQVTNMVGGKGLSMRRVETDVATCVANLAVAVGKEDLWQKLNYQLLLKTRHKKSYVRLGTVKVLKQFYSKLGEEFEVLAPQTIPFLTELLEDDSEEIEALAQEILGNRV